METFFSGKILVNEKNLQIFKFVDLFFRGDKTEEKKAEERDKANQLIQTEQTLSNYLQAGQLSKALRLSLRLDRPRQTKGTLQKLRKAGELERLSRHLT